MSNYTQSTFFTPKDSLITGDPDKIIQGAEIDPEFSGIENAIATKVDAAGVGLSVTSTTVGLDLTALTAAAIEVGDEFFFADVNDANNEKKVTAADLATYLETILVIANMSDYDANQHVDHTAVLITGGEGLTNGGDISASRTIDIDWTELTAESGIVAADLIAFYDATALAHRKVTFAEFEAALDAANIGGGDPGVLESRLLTAGSALSGGGDLSADRTFDLDITEPTTITALEDADLMIVADNSDTNANKNITVANALGVQLGEARYAAASAQSLSAGVPATVNFGASGTDNLTRGTWATNTYTAGASGARILVSTAVQADTLASGASLTVRIKGAGTTVAEATDFNQADSSSNAESVALSAVVSLAAAASMVVEAETSTAEDLASGAPTVISIVELG